MPSNCNFGKGKIFASLKSISIVWFLVVLKDIFILYSFLKKCRDNNRIFFSKLIKFVISISTFCWSLFIASLSFPSSCCDWDIAFLWSLSINLFIGGWIVKDSHKFQMNKIILAFPLIITYLVGPLGLLFYWLIRIFYAKSINLYD